MSKSNYQITAESVSEGHPDKVADQISDAILDAYLENDPDAKVAAECLITSNHLTIAGEVKTNNKHLVDPVGIARKVITDIGYTDQSIGFDVEKADYTLLIHEQSMEINNSVLLGGAGDQGIMFGYACDETPQLMPLPILLSHLILKKLAYLRKSGNIPWLLPDSKSQVTVVYENGTPVGVDNIVVSTQHKASLQNPNNFHEDIRHNNERNNKTGATLVSNKLIYDSVVEEAVRPILKEFNLEEPKTYIINPSGAFTIGGPHGDTGLTGRKIIVDTYGGSCPHGGGAFSGKDPSKVDRSAAYMARYIAKHIVAAGLAKRCTLQLSYAIGMEDPTSIFINFHQSGTVHESLVGSIIRELFDLSPNGIIKTLDLKRPIYLPTAAYGHFGREEFSWEIPDDSILEKLRDII